MGNQVGYENLAVANTAVGFTTATVTRLARSALIYCETAPVRWRADGTAPTSSAGILLEVGVPLILRGEAIIHNIQFIRVESTSAAVHGAFFSDINDAHAIASSQITGQIDDTSPPAGTEGGSRAFRSTPEGNQIVELYKDNNALSPIAAMPGASEVKSLFVASATDSSVRATVINPTSGKKIRIISIIAYTSSSTEHDLELYFADGANITSTVAKAITKIRMIVSGIRNAGGREVFPDGAGPVGAADDDLSFRTDADITTTDQVVVHYREE